jgi:hypothetical protein
VQVSSATPKLSFTACLNRQAEPGFQAEPVETFSSGSSFASDLRLLRPERHKITSEARVNPASDALLLNFVDKLPRSLAGMTWQAIKRWVSRGDATPAPLRDQQASDFVVGRQKPIDSKAFSQTLSAHMAEFPYQPHIGPEHVWSKEGLSYQGLGFWKRVGSAIQGERPLPFPTFARSKLLCALGLGATSVVLPTGREEGLRNWILQQKPGSVEVAQLFRESYKLNQGDLYGTLLCAENVLSEGLYDPHRQDREVTSRLSYLRSDSAPQGDNFGGWYHLFGAALYSLMRPEWKSQVSMKVEDLGSLILEGKDPQEDHLNQLGMEMGLQLKKVAKEGLDRQATVVPYLNLREFPWDRHTVRADKKS